MKFKILGTLSLAILLVIFGRSIAFAQTPEQIAKKHGVIFPIAELGECVDYSSCREYCEDPVNSTACIDFAKKKGFYKEEQVQTQSRFIESAKKELSCDSEDSCREFCSKEANWEKCGEFARKHRLSGGVTHDPKDEEILEKAKVELGCSSHESCMSFCHGEANRQKCSDFANKVGLRGGEHHVGPGGCNSEETCRAFCSDPNNFQECSKFGGGTGGGDRRGFHGPGGCNSEESCRVYCEKNTQDCQIIMVGEHGKVDDPRRATEQYARHCRENPTQCSEGAGPFGSKEGRKEFEKFCTQNPEKCGGGSVHPDADDTSGSIPPSGGYSSDQATECVKYGCTWNGSSCQCSGSQSGSYSTPSSHGTPSYSTPPSDNTPTYGTPSYETPASYGTPYYNTPAYGTPTSPTP